MLTGLTFWGQTSFTNAVILSFTTLSVLCTIGLCEDFWAAMRARWNASAIFKQRGTKTVTLNRKSSWVAGKQGRKLASPCQSYWRDPQNGHGFEKRAVYRDALCNLEGVKSKLIWIYTTSKSSKIWYSRSVTEPTWHRDCMVVNWYSTSLNWTYRHHACNVCQELAHESMRKPYRGCKNKWITGTCREPQLMVSCAELHVDTWTSFRLAMPTNISICIKTLRKEFSSSGWTDVTLKHRDE